MGGESLERVIWMTNLQPFGWPEAYLESSGIIKDSGSIAARPPEPSERMPRW